MCLAMWTLSRSIIGAKVAQNIHRAQRRPHQSANRRGRSWIWRHLNRHGSILTKVICEIGDFAETRKTFDCCWIRRTSEEGCMRAHHAPWKAICW